MSDKDTLALDPATTPLAGTEQVHIVQDGESRRIDVGSIAALAEDPEAVFGAKWELAHHWQWSTNVPNVVVPDLGVYQELLLIGRDLTLNASGFRFFQVSVDNGDTWFTTSGDYVIIATTGIATNAADFGGHGTANAAARTIYAGIRGNIPGAPKRIDFTAGDALFVGSLSPINAIRLATNVANFTGGELFVLGLR